MTKVEHKSGSNFTKKTSIPRPHGLAMGCLFWWFWTNLTALCHNSQRRAYKIFPSWQSPRHDLSILAVEWFQLLENCLFWWRHTVYLDATGPSYLVNLSRRWAGAYIMLTYIISLCFGRKLLGPGKWNRSSTLIMASNLLGIIVWNFSNVHVPVV